VGRDAPGLSQEDREDYEDDRDYRGQDPYSGQLWPDARVSRRGGRGRAVPKTWREGGSRERIARRAGVQALFSQGILPGGYIGITRARIELLGATLATLPFFLELCLPRCSLVAFFWHPWSPWTLYGSL